MLIHEELLITSSKVMLYYMETNESHNLQNDHNSSEKCLLMTWIKVAEGPHRNSVLKKKEKRNSILKNPRWLCTSFIYSLYGKRNKF